MRPIFSVEFKARAADAEFMEESVTLGGPEEFFAFVAPGGGCEAIPGDVGEIKMVFLSPEHPNKANPIADRRVTLQVGMVIFTGPLATIVHAAEQILDKAGRGELSQAFVKVIGAGP